MTSFNARIESIFLSYSNLNAFGRLMEGANDFLEFDYFEEETSTCDAGQLSTFMTWALRAFVPEIVTWNSSTELNLSKPMRMEENTKLTTRRRTGHFRILFTNYAFMYEIIGTPIGGIHSVQ